jgi:putative transposase
MRIQGYNYGTAGDYFITICNYKKMCFLGQIRNSQMELTDTGVYVKSSLDYINTNYNNVSVSCFTVMPNHIHMILTIQGAGGYVVPTDDSFIYGERNNKEKTNDPQTTTVIDIIRNLKTYTGNHYYKACGGLLWQRGYYDHVIRNESEYKRICEYINNNASTWQNDKFYCEPDSYAKAYLDHM